MPNQFENVRIDAERCAGQGIDASGVVEVTTGKGIRNLCLNYRTVSNLNYRTVSNKRLGWSVFIPLEPAAPIWRRGLAANFFHIGLPQVFPAVFSGKT
jgi:hypothetical protein